MAGLGEKEGAWLVDPPYDEPAYQSSLWRTPKQALQPVDPELMPTTGPVFGDDRVRPEDADLTAGQGGEPLGQRINVSGRIVGGDGRPVAHQLVEIWQCNSAGRYVHERDQHPAPLDPHFTGAGRCLTDADGRYRFVTIRPGAYPWRNHPNAWRPAHIHFSVFGHAFTERLITQMYFPGDPLFDFDPIFLGVHDDQTRRRMISQFDWETTEPEYALGYRFDIVVSGRLATPLDPPAAGRRAP
jgi:protocatechuate 3,4-dioxygenase beta subunit